MWQKSTQAMSICYWYLRQQQQICPDPEFVEDIMVQSYFNNKALLIGFSGSSFTQKLITTPSEAASLDYLNIWCEAKPLWKMPHSQPTTYYKAKEEVMPF